MSTTTEAVGEELRCEHCKGPVHRRDDDEGWWCALCGGTPVIRLSDLGYRACSAEGCAYGWDETRGASCRACGGKGLEVDA
jgi:hypothetical protein